MRELLAGLLELLLPESCAGCGAAAPHRPGALCLRCGTSLARIPTGHCDLCQQRPATPEARRCAVCARRRRPLDACLAACWYEGDAAAWVRDFKYPGRRRGLGAPDRARLRALALLTLTRAPADPPDAIVPIPLHPSRLRGRGFNPAGALARDLARPRRIPLRATALRRLRDTQSQTGKKRHERLENVRGAFRANGPVPRHIWLVDDVVTTGATLEEAARALRRAGAKRVIGLCAARTPPRPARS